MAELLLNEDQRDALQEINNIAMGMAGRSLAEMLDVFITLSIPRIKIVQSSVMQQSLSEVVGEQSNISVVRQSFSGPIEGESLILFTTSDTSVLARLMGYDGDLSETSGRELMLDTANVLFGSFRSGLASVLNVDFTVSAPTILAENVHINDLIQKDQLLWDSLVMIQITFEIEEHGFVCYLAQLMPDTSIETLRQTIDQFIESLI